MGTDDVFAVIAEGTRRQILRNLRDGDKAVGELVVELQVSQPTVSKHLKVLREAGLVTMRAQGQKRFYSLETAPLQVVRNWLAVLDGSDAAEVLPFDLTVEAESQAAADAETAVAAMEVVAEHEAAQESQPEPADEVQEILAPAVLAVPEPFVTIDTPRPPIGRTMGRAAERAADLLAQLRRRRDS